MFVEGLNLASGIEVGFGGVWIGAAPELLFIPDGIRDDKPGRPPEVLLDGWGYQDTHETLNSFTWGPDGWLYGNQGVFTQFARRQARRTRRSSASRSSRRLALSSGAARVRNLRPRREQPVGSRLQRSNGHLFMTHCRSFLGRGGTTHVIRNGHFWNQANANYAPFISATAPDFAPDLQKLPACRRAATTAAKAARASRAPRPCMAATRTSAP